MERETKVQINYWPPNVCMCVCGGGGGGGGAVCGQG